MSDDTSAPLTADQLEKELLAEPWHRSYCAVGDTDLAPARVRHRLDQAAAARELRRSRVVVPVRGRSHGLLTTSFVTDDPSAEAAR